MCPSVTAKAETTARVREICRLAMEGDRAARQTLHETCRYLGIGIANVVWGLDADAVIIDGTLGKMFLQQSLVLVFSRTEQS